MTDAVQTKGNENHDDAQNAQNEWKLAIKQSQFDQKDTAREQKQETADEESSEPELKYSHRTLVMMNIPDWVTEDHVWEAFCSENDKSFQDVITNITIARKIKNGYRSTWSCECMNCLASRYTIDYVVKAMEKEKEEKKPISNTCRSYYSSLRYCYIDFKTEQDATNALAKYRFIKIYKNTNEDRYTKKYKFAVVNYQPPIQPLDDQKSPEKESEINTNKESDKESESGVAGLFGSDSENESKPKELSEAERMEAIKKHSPVCQLMYKVDRKLLGDGAETTKARIFIKNLHESIDEPTLYETFGVFGQILCVRIYWNKQYKQACPKGPWMYCYRSMGYGYVQYIDPKDAAKAIEGVNGMTISDRRVYCSLWKAPKTRQDKMEKVNSIFIKNIPCLENEKRKKKKQEILWTVAEIKDMMQAFVSRITSCKEWFRAFNMSFASVEEAERAIRLLDAAMLSANKWGTKFEAMQIDKSVKRKELYLPKHSKRRKEKNKKYQKFPLRIEKIMKSMKDVIKNGEVQKKVALYAKDVIDKGYVPMEMFSKYGNVLDLVKGGDGVFVLYEDMEGALKLFNKVYYGEDIKDEDDEKKDEEDEMEQRTCNPLLQTRRKRKSNRRKREQKVEFEPVIMAIILINDDDFTNFM